MFRSVGTELELYGERGLAMALQEDDLLKKLVAKMGARNWSMLARKLPGRTGKSCRLR